MTCVDFLRVRAGVCLRVSVNQFTLAKCCGRKYAATVVEISQRTAFTETFSLKLGHGL